MADEALAESDAGGLAAAHRARRRSVVESLEQTLQQLQHLEPRLNAFAFLDPAGARAAAMALDAALAAGGPVGPLVGVPVGVKDILNVAGQPTRWGSRLLAEAPPAKSDMVAVARLRAAGALFPGKTTTSEFAHSMMGRSPLTGLTRNPWAPELTCGGSSCGAAASVAAGEVPLALATDAGASTRLPAALCGILGLKPTLGLVPHDLVPDGFANFIHLGLMARTTADLVLMLQVVAGPAPADPFSLLAAPFEAKLTPAVPAGRRVGLILRAGNRRLSTEIEVLLRDKAEQLRALGLEIEEIEAPIENPEPTWRTLQQMNWAGRLGAQLEEVRARIDPSFATGIEAGLATSAGELQRALQARTTIFRKTQALFERFDFLLTPVAAAPALPAEHPVLAPITIDGEEVGDMRREWTPYLNWFDLTGHPAISVPAGRTENGAPMGVQLVAGWHREVELLSLVAALEQAAPWPRLAPVEALAP